MVQFHPEVPLFKYKYKTITFILIMNLQQLLRQLLSGFMSALGWRAANMMPPILVLILLLLALVFGVQW